MLESELFFSGVRPAVNVGLSVSRVGRLGPDQGPAKVRASCGWTWPSIASWRCSPSSPATWTMPPSSSWPMASG